MVIALQFCVEYAVTNNKSFENVAKFKYTGTSKHVKITLAKTFKSGLNSENARYHSIQKFLSSPPPFYKYTKQ
jgi:hypothetical protein